MKYSWSVLFFFLVFTIFFMVAPHKSNNHVVIIVSGLGDNLTSIGLATKFWRRFGLEPIIFDTKWKNREENFETKLKRLTTLIDDHVKQGNKASLLGTSAGSSLSLNAFFERKEVINKVVSVCGRLRRGQLKGLRGFEIRTESFPAFAESVKLFETREKELSNNDKGKILTVSSMFGDELVPLETSMVVGATNIKVPTPEHVFSIAMSLTLFSQPIVNFLNQ